MINLNNTWCEATEENYNALIKLGYKTQTKIYRRSIFIWVVDEGFSVYNCKLNEATINHHRLKQIHLVNGEFQYVETKPKNNFKDYGFTANFEGEILKKIGDYYVGYIGRDYCTIIDSTKWDLEGNDVDMQEYHLKPIKKEWYENADNFPCLCIDSYDNPIIIFSKEEYDKCPRIRPATKEEVLSLLIKE